jgi:hypothetical protein
VSREDPRELARNWTHPITCDRTRRLVRCCAALLSLLPHDFWCTTGRGNSDHVVSGRKNSLESGHYSKTPREDPRALGPDRTRPINDDQTLCASYDTPRVKHRMRPVIPRLASGHCLSNPFSSFLFTLASMCQHQSVTPLVHVC